MSSSIVVGLRSYRVSGSSGAEGSWAVADLAPGLFRQHTSQGMHDFIYNRFKKELLATCR